MSLLEVADGAKIFYKDWGKGQPVVFSHGRRLTPNALDDQMLFLVTHGYRCIAYAGDLAALVTILDLHDVILVGHSSGCGDVVRYAARYGTARISKVFLTAFAEGLREIDVPTLVLHLDDAEGGPVASSSLLTANLVKHCQRGALKGSTHGASLDCLICQEQRSGLLALDAVGPLAV
jgi:alpha-beta hydrolase superfamily lysophospholipase